MGPELSGPEKGVMAQTRAEQETVIRWDRDDEQAHIWSADPVTWRKLAKKTVVTTTKRRSR